MKASSKNLVICCALGALATLTAANVQAASILVDPGAELHTGWSFFNGAGYSGTFFHSGTQSIKDLGGATNGSFETFAATAGQAFTMTGFGMTPTTLPGTQAGFLQITYWSGANGTGTNLGTVETVPGLALTSNQITSASATNTWIPLSVTATAPATTQSMQVFTLVNPGGAGAVYFDDMTLDTTPEPGSLTLAGMAGVALLSRTRRRK